MRPKTNLGEHIRSLYRDEKPSEAVKEFGRVFDLIPKARGPIQDESEFCDPVDAAGMREVQGRVG